MSESYDLGKKMRVGALWVYMQGWFGTAVQFGSGIVLARLLEPADFGVFYAVTAYSAILLSQVRFGIPASLLQAKDVEEVQWQSSFWFMQGLALLCTVLVLAFSNTLQTVYRDGRYTSIMIWSCANFFIMPFTTVNGTMLQRRMEYKVTSKIQIVSLFVTTVVSIAFASAGFGPFSLVASGIIGSLLSTVMMAWIAPWRPRWGFSASRMKPLLGYGWRLHLNNTLNMLAGRVDNMLVGGLAGVATLGIYNRAYNLSRMPLEQVVSRLYELVFSGLSRVQDDLDHSVMMYRKVLCAMVSAVFPLLLCLFFVAEGFVSHLYGSKWVPCVGPLKIMLIGAFAAVVSITLGALADAQALVAKETPVQILNVGMTLAAVLGGARWGLSGIAAGIAAKDYLLLLLMARMLRRSHLRLGWTVLMGAMYPALVGTVVGSIAGVVAGMTVGGYFGAASVVSVVGVGSSVLLTYAVVWLLIVHFSPNNVPLQSNASLLADATRSVARRFWGVGCP